MSTPYEVEFIRREPCGEDVVTVRFTRPPGFAFVAGQWMVLTLSAGAERLTETFTICSAPGDDYLEITTRLSGSPFKSVLAAMGRGDRAGLAGPGGRLKLSGQLERVAFLVGGVGITPVRSMLRDARASGRVFEDAVLFYGNRDASCVPFHDELAEMSPFGVRMVLCYEHPLPGWNGETGFITAEMVRRHVEPEADDRPFIVAGPPQMVANMERVLDGLGVGGERRLVERFGPRTPAAAQVFGDAPTR